MALVSVLGTSATVAVDATGATPITDWVDSVDLGDSYNANDVTTLGHLVVVEDPGLESFDIKLSGFWDAALDTILAAEKGVLGHHLIVHPQGTGAGHIKLDYTGWMDAINLTIGVAASVTWDTVFHARALTRTVL